MLIYTLSKLLPEIVCPLLIVLCMADVGVKGYLCVVQRRWLYGMHALLEVIMAIAFGCLTAKVYTALPNNAAAYEFMFYLSLSALSAVMLTMQVIRWFELASRRND